MTEWVQLNYLEKSNHLKIFYVIISWKEMNLLNISFYIVAIRI